MKRLVIAATAAASLALVSCGGSLCSRMNDMPSKQGTCTGTTVTNKKYDLAKCDKAVADSCNQGDQKAMDEFITCYSAVAACETGKEAAFATAVTACAGKMATVSTKCQEGLAAASQ